MVTYVVLCTALSLGQSESKAGQDVSSPEPIVIEAPFAAPPAPPPTALPPAPAAAPDRWIVMKALQGTWPGALLDGERMQLTGWTEASFNASSAQNNNLPLGFNYRANEFALQQDWLRFERAVVTTGTTEPTFGFRSDIILPGIDYRFTLARGIFDDQLTARHGLPNIYGIDPIQFYGEAYFPTVGRGMDVKVGRFFAQYGVEANDAVSNALASHAYTFIYDPFTHTGVLTTAKLTDAWSVQAGMVLGSDIFIDPADTPTFIGSVKWVRSDQRDSVLFSVILGSGRFNQARNFHNPEVFDLVYTHQFNPRLNYNFESLFGFTTHVPDIGTADWFGVLSYLTYNFTPRLSATTRLEFFDDAQGQRTGFAGLYTGWTAGVSFRPRKDIILRPEIRYDYNEESRPFEGKHGLFTATADVILRW
jgi:Putative beta-barrel porin-2, OmpL-like. bbp2